MFGLVWCVGEVRSCVCFCVIAWRAVGVFGSCWACLVLCLLPSCVVLFRSSIVAFYVSFYARYEQSTRSTCARFATCVQKRPIRQQEKTKPKFSFLSVSCLGLSWIVLSCLCLVLCVVLCLVSRLVLSIVGSLTMDKQFDRLC